MSQKLGEDKKKKVSFRDTGSGQGNWGSGKLGFKKCEGQGNWEGTKKTGVREIRRILLGDCNKLNGCYQCISL